MFIILLAACTTISPTSTKLSADDAYRGDVWADNWFAMYIGDQLVVEDSVPITTERSFNAERFSFDANPGDVLAFVLKDFKQTDSGLEYIGSRKQQMGDGGFIAQVTQQPTSEVVRVRPSEILSTNVPIWLMACLLLPGTFATALRDLRRVWG